MPGAGIGLALVRELAEANGGSIELQSVAGEGATFTAVLPVSDGDEAMVMSQQAETVDLAVAQMDVEQQVVEVPILAEAGSDERPCVLIVEDNLDLSNMLSSALADSYRCLTAVNGQEGLELAKEQLPDMILSDIMMPVMDGYELAKQLKANVMTCHIPLILLTAKGSVESRVKGLKLLVDDYLPKPFNIEELRLRVHNILTIRRILRQRFGQAMDQPQPGEAMRAAGLSARDQEFVDKVLENLEAHYSDPQFNMKSLAGKLLVSDKQLQRKIRGLFDVSFPELMRNFRLNKAASLLREDERASQVYFTVGFSSHSYFTSCFKAKFGMTPSQYKKAQK